MSTDVTATRTALSERVAEEIRVAMVRRRMSGRELARLLDVSPSWVSYRLTGAQPIDLNDLQRIAEALGVEVHALIPGVLRVTNPSHTLASGQRPQMARNATRNVRPSDRRPIGRAQASTGPSGQRRTSRVA